LENASSIFVSGVIIATLVMIGDLFIVLLMEGSKADLAGRPKEQGLLDERNKDCLIDVYYLSDGNL